MFTEKGGTDGCKSVNKKYDYRRKSGFMFREDILDNKR
jgi:hypothetical protein